MNFFTSDPHFFHNNVIKYDNRPFTSVEEMNNAIISRWNSIVSSNDTVYVCGDFGLCPIISLHNLLNSLEGKKILILGNHDRYQHSQYIKAGFDAVYYELVMKLGQKIVKLSHYPYKTSKLSLWWEQFYRGKDYSHINKKKPIRNEEDWLIHGHVHNGYKKIDVKKKQINVGCFAWDYFPVSETDIHRLIDMEGK